MTAASPAAGAAPGVAAIEHVIVLVLENRSFDHLLGFLRHPHPADFDGVLGPDGFTVKQDLVNYLLPTDQSTAPCRPEPKADYTVPEDPDHSHYAVMGQIQRVKGVDDSGFVHSYAHKAAGTEQAETRRRIIRTWARRVGLLALIGAVVSAALSHWIWTAIGWFGLVRDATASRDSERGRSRQCDRAPNHVRLPT